MLDQRHRRWTNFETILGLFIVFAGYIVVYGLSLTLSPNIKGEKHFHIIKNNVGEII